MTSNVLVTGGAGYVGSTLIPELLNIGHSVRVLDILTYGGSSLLSNFGNPNFEFINGDATKESDLKAALKDIDVIIHLAALVGFPACKKNPELAEKLNVGSTQLLVDLKSDGQLLIYASTGSVYGVVKDSLCTEETPTNAISIYGETKRRSEVITLQSGGISFRFATAFGLSPRLRLDLLINNFVYQAIKNKQLIVYEKSFKRTFIHVKDMAYAFIFGMNNADKMKGEVYNVGSSSMNFTKEEVCQLIKKKIDYFLHFADFAEDEDKRDYEVSYVKMNKLGFKTSISMEQGIDELINAMAVIEIPNIYSNHAVL